MSEIIPAGPDTAEQCSKIPPWAAITSEAIRRGYEVLAHLMTVNTGMGHAVRRMNNHAIEHGHLPVDELRTLAELLDAVADELREYAGQLDRPVIQIS